MCYIYIMSLPTLNNILKLKIIKVKYSMLFKNKYLYVLSNEYFIGYILYLNFIFKTDTFLNFNLLNSISLANYKFNKLKFFNNSTLNFLVIYNLLLTNKISMDKLLSNTKITNYSYKFMFIYYFYFIKNIKFGLSRYFNTIYQNNFYFIKFFISKFLNFFFKDKNLYLKFNKNNIEILSNKNFYFLLLKKIRYLKFLNDINLKSKSFLNLLLIVLYSKDVILFKNSLKNILENLHFKTHRKFLYNLKLILKSLSYIFYTKFKCLGILIQVKGKIGVGGNSKKRKFLYKFGSFSFTKKNQHLNYSKDSIRTYSGVLGLEIYMTYL